MRLMVLLSDPPLRAPYLLQKVKLLKLSKFPTVPLRGILRVPPKSAFKRLILETPLWQGAMSFNLKSPHEVLKDTECKNGTLPI